MKRGGHPKSLLSSLFGKSSRQFCERRNATEGDIRLATKNHSNIEVRKSHHSVSVTDRCIYQRPSDIRTRSRCLSTRTCYTYRTCWRREDRKDPCMFLRDVHGQFILEKVASPQTITAFLCLISSKHVGLFSDVECCNYPAAELCAECFHVS